MSTMIETITYRIILIDPVSRGIFALRKDGLYHLPILKIPQWKRPAEQLQRGIRDTWNVPGIILGFLPNDDSCKPCAAAEVLATPSADQLTYIPLSGLAPDDLSEAQRASVERMLDGSGDQGSFFSRIGWLDQVVAWCETVTNQRLSSRSSIIQYNAGGSFTLLRLPLDDGQNYWLKATGEPNRHEYAVTLLLSDVCKGFTPDVVATQPEWNAWLMAGAGTDTITFPSEPLGRYKLMEHVMYCMLEAETESVEVSQQLLRAGAFDQSMEVISESSGKLFDYLERAMSLQTSTKAPRLEAKCLRQLHDKLLKVCEVIGNLGLPQTVVHGDLNDGNIIIGESACQFIDWAECYVGPPGINLEHLLLLNRMEDCDLQRLINFLVKERYVERWGQCFDRFQTEQARPYWAFLAIVSSLYGRMDWLDRPERDGPQSMAYRRSLARHMNHAAEDPEFREALCR
ncbi:aminoglycoside phosphotransferase family protein [Edaphobacter flagellatus]|uniref:aminoglycoside phosphotransferase family protein n=1 Tax=Edaphobacter flagellatus TaxID=1933044 RepID=UPI0021B2305B|nr:aminoglycoside phosphotransferase family protein [Edaphobacter flagellatus]